MDIEQYFQGIENYVDEVYNIAKISRSKNLDPSDEVEIIPVRNMGEKVEGLVSVLHPQIKGKGIPNRIIELEETYGKLDWRVALTMALEIAQEKFCNFSNKIEAIEAGIRIGFAYITLGSVSSPLEGFVKLVIKKRKDGKDYFCLFYSGPVRSAGGTGASVSVLIADYLRKQLGYDKYDATEKEIKRTYTELVDYHERVTNLQYFPSEQEIEFLVSHLPVQIDGDPSEKYEVSNYKDIERIETNRLRNGFCLVIAECLAQKAPKVLAQLQKWGKDFNMNDWDFMAEFVSLQKKLKAKQKVDDTKQKIKADYTYIKDIVAGRPVLTYPLMNGGFRLRYGRSRNTGLSSMAIHPATMAILKNFIAIGTQLKVERPGKSTALGSCDTIEGPIVKLNNGDVIFIEEFSTALNYADKIKEILFLGDILVNYGDFLNRAHILVPPGYCEEWWAIELENKIKEGKKSDMDEGFLKNIIESPLKTKVDFDEAYEISKVFDIPLHPRYTLHWKDISVNEFKKLIERHNTFEIVKADKFKIIIPSNTEIKKVLERLGLPHKQASENIIVEEDWAKSLLLGLGVLNNHKKVGDLVFDDYENTLAIVNALCDIKVMDKSGICIGARMGRPEKAKLRKLTGSPHVLFPVGEEGGRLRAFQSAIETSIIFSEFPIQYCKECNEYGIYRTCHKCNKKTSRAYFCEKCNKLYEKESCKLHGNNSKYNKRPINIVEYMEASKKRLNLTQIPELIKGIRGTSNEDHVTEDLSKGILRAMHNLTVNKDGTIRYDMTETSLTHFKPLEIGTAIEKLIDLGYEQDIYGEPLTNENQTLELKVQDVVLPTCAESLEEGADAILFRISKFIDDLLVHFYKQESYYKIKDKNDLIGHLVIGLAPHTSAGIIGRIIGFSKTQGCYAHPMWHCAIRRDCFSYDTNIPLFFEGGWHNIKIGEFVERLNPTQVVDSYGTLSKDVSEIRTLAFNDKTNKIDVMPIKWFTKHTKTSMVKLILENGREIKTTLNHKFYIKSNDLKIKTANDILVGDKLLVPYNIELCEKDISFLSLERIYENNNNIVIREIKRYVHKKISVLSRETFCTLFDINKKNLENWLHRDSFPILLVNKVLRFFNEDYGDLPKKRTISFKRQKIAIPCNIPINSDLLEIIGFYISEGYSRKKDSDKGFYQVDFAIYEKGLRTKIKRKIYSLFSILPAKTTEERLTYCSKIFYEFITNFLQCGSNAHEKRIPSIFLDLPKEKIKHLLAAYFEGDGSVSKSDLRITCDTVSKGLISDLEFVLSRFKIYVRKYKSKREPGKKVKEFYTKKNRQIPKFESTKLTIPPNFTKQYYDQINFLSKRKKTILSYIVHNIKPYSFNLQKDECNVCLSVTKKEILNEEPSYCLNVPGHHNVIANGIVSRQCDGDECGIILLLDGLLNFSRKFLPAHRGSTQDAPLVLTTKLIPSEVDDMVFDMDVCWRYPLEFYNACLDYKNPNELKLDIIKRRLGTEKQYKDFGFTHDTFDFNLGVRCSAYKSLPSMLEKVRGQMALAEMIRAVDTDDVARLVIERHFIRDIRGNLRKFSMQQFRCSKCNKKYRRPPLIGKCQKCDGKIIFTISEGSIVKYMKPSLELANKYRLSPYLKQSLEITKSRIESLFGKEKEMQSGLTSWFE